MITKKDHRVMCNFCWFLGKIGLAPYGLNLLSYDYIKENTLKSFIYRFWLRN